MRYVVEVDTTGDLHALCVLKLNKDKSLVVEKIGIAPPEYFNKLLEEVKKHYNCTSIEEVLTKHQTNTSMYKIQLNKDSKDAV